MGVQLGEVPLGCPRSPADFVLGQSPDTRCPDREARQQTARRPSIANAEAATAVHHAHHRRPCGRQARSSPEITVRSHESRVCWWPECYSDLMMIPEPGISTASRGLGARSGTRTGENSPIRTYRGRIPGSGIFHLNVGHSNSPYPPVSGHSRWSPARRLPPAPGDRRFLLSVLPVQGLYGRVSSFSR